MKKIFRKRAKFSGLTIHSGCTYNYNCCDCDAVVEEHMDICPNCGRKLSYRRPTVQIKSHYNEAPYNERMYK